MLTIHGRPAPVPDGDRVESRITFRPGMPNTSHQRRAWHGLAYHWTGGERAASGVARTLLDSRLSVQFVVEADGHIVQTADVMTKCAHIGGGNEFFLGAEFVCRGYATPADLAAARAKDPTLRERDELDWATPRDTYRDVIGGRVVSMAGFNVEQLRSAVWLAETLAGVVGFPRRIPARVVKRESYLRERSPLPDELRRELLIEHDGATWAPDFSRDDRPRTIAASRVASYRGLLGHFHVHEAKHDPGTQPFYALWVEGWNPAGRKLPGLLPL